MGIAIVAVVLLIVILVITVVSSNSSEHPLYEAPDVHSYRVIESTKLLIYN